MYYTIYKITNQINNKFYIGKHQTENLDDGYMGSGRAIKAAIRKHGKDNFVKEILYTFDNPETMNQKEIEMVDEGVVNNQLCYNMCIGGFGGNFVERKGKTYQEIYGDRAMEVAQKISLSKIGEKNPMFGRKVTKEHKLKLKKVSHLKNLTVEERRRAIETRTIRAASGEIIYGMTGKKHKEESKKKTSLSLLGHLGANKGRIWINNGVERKMIPQSEIVPTGWIRGKHTKA